MAGPSPDGDRLPWLDPVGPRKAAVGPRAAVRGLTIIVVVLALALAGAVSLLLLRDRQGPSARVDLPSSPLPRPIPAPVALPPTPVADKTSVSPPKPVASTPKPDYVVGKARPEHRRVKAHRPSHHKVRIHRGRPKPARVSPASRASVVQLGAFNSPREAEIAWQGAVRDYRYLGTLPKIVTPVRVGPHRRLYYRLRIGAPSPRHAILICRAVRAMRRSCIVTR